MKIDHNIGDTVYILLEDVIRPVTITAININKHGIKYDIEHVNAEGFKIHTGIGEKFAFKKASDLIIFLMNEYNDYLRIKGDYDLSNMPTNISTKEKY